MTVFYAILHFFSFLVNCALDSVKSVKPYYGALSVGVGEPVKILSFTVRDSCLHVSPPHQLGDCYCMGLSYVCWSVERLVF